MVSEKEINFGFQTLAQQIEKGFNFSLDSNHLKLNTVCQITLKLVENMFKLLNSKRKIKRIFLRNTLCQRNFLALKSTKSD